MADYKDAGTVHPMFHTKVYSCIYQAMLHATTGGQNYNPTLFKENFQPAVLLALCTAPAFVSAAYHLPVRVLTILKDAPLTSLLRRSAIICPYRSIGR